MRKTVKVDLVAVYLKHGDEKNTPKCSITTTYPLILLPTQQEKKTVASLWEKGVEDKVLQN